MTASCHPVFFLGKGQIDMPLSSPTCSFPHAGLSKHNATLEGYLPFARYDRNKLVEDLAGMIRARGCAGFSDSSHAATISPSEREVLQSAFMQAWVRTLMENPKQNWRNDAFLMDIASDGSLESKETDPRLKLYYDEIQQRAPTELSMAIFRRISLDRLDDLSGIGAEAAPLAGTTPSATRPFLTWALHLAQSKEPIDTVKTRLKPWGLDMWSVADVDAYQTLSTHVKEPLDSNEFPISYPTLPNMFVDEFGIKAAIRLLHQERALPLQGFSEAQKAAAERIYQRIGAFIKHESQRIERAKTASLSLQQLFSPKIVANAPVHDSEAGAFSPQVPHVPLTAAHRAWHV